MVVCNVLDQLDQEEEETRQEHKVQKQSLQYGLKGKRFKSKVVQIM